MTLREWVQQDPAEREWFETALLEGLERMSRDGQQETVSTGDVDPAIWDETFRFWKAAARSLWGARH